MERSRNNNLITPDRLAVIELTKAGIHSSYLPNEDIVANVNWQNVFTLAKQQTISGLCWDGILKLSEKLQPPRDIKFQWYGYVLKIEKANQHLDGVAAKVFSAFLKGGICPIMLKGQGLAKLYPNPLRRQCGDIDIYVGHEFYDKANEIGMGELEGKNFAEERHNSDITIDGVLIEVHHTMSTIYSKKKLRNFHKALSDWFPNNPSSVELNGVKVFTPQQNFNEAYVMLHFYKHLLENGIGLRQLVDWGMVAREVSKDEIILHEYDKIRETLSFLCVHYLGFKKKDFPYYSENVKFGAHIMDVMFKEGNFGHLVDINKKKTGSFLAVKAYNLKYMISRWLYMARYIPDHTFENMVGYFKGRVKAAFNGKF